MNCLFETLIPYFDAVCKWLTLYLFVHLLVVHVDALANGLNEELFVYFVWLRVARIDIRLLISLITGIFLKKIDVIKSWNRRRCILNNRLNLLYLLRNKVRRTDWHIFLQALGLKVRTSGHMVLWIIWKWHLTRPQLLLLQYRWHQSVITKPKSLFLRVQRWRWWTWVGVYTGRDLFSRTLKLRCFFWYFYILLKQGMWITLDRELRVESHNINFWNAYLGCFLCEGLNQLIQLRFQFIGLNLRHDRSLLRCNWLKLLLINLCIFRLIWYFFCILDINYLLRWYCIRLTLCDLSSISKAHSLGLLILWHL